MKKPILIKAGSDLVLLGTNKKPPSLDVRVVAEDYYQEMLDLLKESDELLVNWINNKTTHVKRINELRLKIEQFTKP